MDRVHDDAHRATPDPGPGRGRRVLVVEDESRLARLLGEILARDGYLPEIVHDGGSGLRAAVAGGYDVVLLDLMLPGMAGDEVLRRLRRIDGETPVIMLTARDEVATELTALGLGADDFITKPFRAEVLLARVSAAMRRSGRGPVVDCGPLRLDLPGRRLWVDGTEVALSVREFDLLAYLVDRRGIAVSKQELLDEVWDEPYGHPNLVEVCMVGLRRRIGTGHVQTVRGIGYRVQGDRR